LWRYRYFVFVIVALIGYWTIPGVIRQWFARDYNKLPFGALVSDQMTLGWLGLADKGDAGATYDAAGAQFRKAMTRERWGEALASERMPLGALQRRTMANTTFRTGAAGAAPQELALVRFRTEFAMKPGARETVTLEREPDDRWRVVGYKLQ